jgi:ribosomal protein L4
MANTFCVMFYLCVNKKERKSGVRLAFSDKVNKGVLANVAYVISSNNQKSIPHSSKLAKLLSQSSVMKQWIRMTFVSSRDDADHRSC